MPRTRTREVRLSQDEILETLHQGLIKQATRPNIFGYVPHDKQFLFHKSTAKVILYIGGNRSGKTTGGAVEAIYRLGGRHPYKQVKPAPVYGRAHSVDFLYGCDKIILPEIQRWCPPSLLVNGSWEDSYDKNHRTLTFSNKSVLEFKSYEQDLDKFAGTSRDFNWYDEEPPRHIYNESQARLIDVNGDAFLTMTPVDGMTWVYDEIYEPYKDSSDSNYLVIEIEMTENPHITKEAAELYLSTLDKDERTARQRGEFVAMGGRIFKNFSYQVHVVPPINPRNLWEQGWQPYCSIDHGLNNPTAMMWHAVSADSRIITFGEHYKSEMLVRDHAEEYHRRTKLYGIDPSKLITIGDPAMHQRNGATGTSIIQAYAENGVYIGTEVESDVKSGLDKMIEYLREDESIGGKPRWQITNECPKLAWEMKKYRWATYSSRKIQFEKNKQEVPHKKDDHATDSSRYVFTFMPDLTPVRSIPVPTLSNPLNAVTGVDPTFDRWDEVLKREGMAFRSGEMVTNKTKWDVDEGLDLFQN
jgi:phage terminase large subunit-like protein